MWRASRRLFSIAPIIPGGGPKRSKLPLFLGLAAVGGSALVGYFQYQDYLNDKQAKDIAADVKRKMTEPAPPLLKFDKVKEESPKAEEIVFPAAESPKEHEKLEPLPIIEVVQPSKDDVLVEAKAQEPTLSIQAPASPIVIDFPNEIKVEAPQAASTQTSTPQEGQLTSMIHDLQTSLENAREEIKHEQYKRVRTI